MATRGGGESLNSRLAGRDPLAVGMTTSLAAHLLIMFVHFAPPAPIKFKPTQSDLEVVLLNSQTPDRPVAADVIAQVDNVGGGDRDEGRARSPLPPDVVNRDGDQVQRSARRVQELETEQQRLLALARSEQTVARKQEARDKPANPDAADAENEGERIARMQAQIDKQIEDYNKRPRRLTYGVNARSEAFAQYVAAWTEKIERIGTERIPQEARGRLYDSLIVTVEVDRYGNVKDVLVNRKSKYETLNRLIKEIVLAGAPYDRFTPEMQRDGDLLQIVRTWTFTSDSLKTGAVKN